MCEWVEIKWKIVLDCEPEGWAYKSKKLKKYQERQKKLADTEEGLWFKQSSLIACNQQLPRGAAAASSSHHKLQIKIAVLWN